MKRKVQVLLSTYNGQRYLREQLESLLAQESVLLSILVRDDGSTDGTVGILQEYKDRNQLDFYVGNNIGYARSFIDLLLQNMRADYYVFCDQDDVWLSNKVIRGIDEIEKNKDKYLLYTSALTRVDADLNFLSEQCFKNLVLSLGAEFTRHRLAGCTFVFNNNLYDLLIRKHAIKQVKCSHDKFITILCLAVGGRIVFDKTSRILFRRYGSNASVDGKNIFNKCIKELQSIKKRKSRSLGLSTFLLENYNDVLDENSRMFLNKIVIYRMNLANTLELALDSRINCGFWFYNLFIRCVILLRFF